MRPSEIIHAIKTCRELKRPLFLWGPPGIGKSALVEQSAKDLGINMIDFRVALRDPTDFKGFPMPDTKRGTMTFFRDEELPRDGEGILFMDELNTGAQMVQNVAMQLALYPHRIGNYQLPAGWSIVAAGNRETDRGVANRMPTTVASRFVHADIEANVEDFTNWLQDQLASGNDVGSPELIAYFRFQSKNFFTFDPKSQNRVFGCPRTWVAADAIRQKLVPTNKDGRMDKKTLKDSGSIAYELMKGTVGEGEGTDYWSFLRMAAELPSIDEIRMNPDTAPVPSNMAGQYAIVTTLATHTHTGANMANFMEYIKRLTTEFQAVYIRDCLRRKPDLKMDKTFTKWALKNEEVFK